MIYLEYLKSHTYIGKYMPLVYSTDAGPCVTEPWKVQTSIREFQSTTFASKTHLAHRLKTIPDEYRFNVSADSNIHESSMMRRARWRLA